MSKKAVVPSTKNVKFVHCRNVTDDGKVAAHGGMTIAYYVDSAFKVVGYAAAKCHSNDNYNKHIGRAKAAGRLLSSSYYEQVPEPMDEVEFIKRTKEGFTKFFNTPAF